MWLLNSHAGLGSDVKADHVDAPAGKRLYGEGRGGGHDAGDLLRRGQVGIDDHVKADLLFQHIGIPTILRTAHTGNGVVGAQLLGDEAAEQVRVVQVGDGDDQIRRLCAGLLQHADGGAVALDAHDVQRVLRLVQGGGAVIHHNDVVVLPCQLAGNGVAHLSVSHDDNFHFASSFPSGGRMIFVSLFARRKPLYSAPMMST